MARSGKKPPKAITEANWPQVLKDLSYMIDQLRGAYGLSFQNNPNRIAHNAFVESWGMHARALTEFFMGNKIHSVEVRHLVDNQYQILGSVDGKALYTKISNQMQVRPSKDEDKVRPNTKDMKRLEDEIDRFQKHLRAEYRSMFVLRTTRELFEIIGPPQASATSSLPTLAAGPPPGVKSNVKPSSWWGWLPWRR